MDHLPTLTELLGAIAASLGGLYALARNVITPGVERILREIAEHRAESALRHTAMDLRLTNLEGRTTALEAGHTDLAARLPPLGGAAPALPAPPAPNGHAPQLHGLAAA